MGTGYGKNLIFKGLAILGDKGKVVIVVSPLKALECDQVCLLTVLVICCHIDIFPGQASKRKGH